MTSRNMTRRARITKRHTIVSGDCLMPGVADPAMAAIIFRCVIATIFLSRTCVYMIYFESYIGCESVCKETSRWWIQFYVSFVRVTCVLPPLGQPIS
jgi:hypothetical protein